MALHLLKKNARMIVHGYGFDNVNTDSGSGVAEDLIGTDFDSSNFDSDDVSDLTGLAIDPDAFDDLSVSEALGYAIGNMFGVDTFGNLKIWDDCITAHGKMKIYFDSNGICYIPLNYLGEAAKCLYDKGALDLESNIPADLNYTGEIYEKEVATGDSYIRGSETSIKCGPSPNRLALWYKADWMDSTGHDLGAWHTMSSESWSLFKPWPSTWDMYYAFDYTGWKHEKCNTVLSYIRCDLYHNYSNPSYSPFYVTVFRNTSNIPIFNTYEDAMNYINSGVVSDLTSPSLCGGTYMKPKNSIPGVTADSSIVQIDWTADTYTVLSQIIKANPNIVVGEKQDSAGVLYIMLKAHQRG